MAQHHVFLTSALNGGEYFLPQYCYEFGGLNDSSFIKFYLTNTALISGFHRALLVSITFINRPNARDYTKLKHQNLRCIKG